MPQRRKKQATIEIEVMKNGCLGLVCASRHPKSGTPKQPQKWHISSLGHWHSVTSGIPFLLLACLRASFSSLGLVLCCIQSDSCSVVGYITASRLERRRDPNSKLAAIERDSHMRGSPAKGCKWRLGWFWVKYKQNSIIDAYRRYNSTKKAYTPNNSTPPHRNLFTASLMLISLMHTGIY